MRAVRPSASALFPRLHHAFRVAGFSLLVAGLAAGVPAGSLPVAAKTAAVPDCRFVLGFAALWSLLGPERVGACVEDQRFVPNGNAEQRTTNGLLVWRKIDNFTAFTDGYRSWVNGPDGLQTRFNTQRFAWEAESESIAADLTAEASGGGAAGASGSTGAGGAAGAATAEAPARTIAQSARGEPPPLQAALQLPALGTPLEAALFERVNADRLNAGLQPVQPDPALLPIARTRAAAQLSAPQLSHYDGSGKLAFVELIERAGLRYSLAGENLARLHAPEAAAAEQAEQALMDSPTHRANILGPTFNRMAVGAATDASGRIAFAQVFRAL